MNFVHGYYILSQYKDKFKLTVVKHMSFGERNGEGSRDVNEDKLINNISRSRNKIYEYALCNDWDYFATLTLDPKRYDRYNLDKYIKDLGQFVRDERKRTGNNIQYLLIPEPHKDGAWHMHGYFKGLPKASTIKNKNGYLHWQAYSDKFGYCSLDIIKNKEACDKYITKYISKELVRSSQGRKNKKLYYASRGLNTAVRIAVGALDMENLSPDYENDYVAVQWFDDLETAKQLL